MPREKSWEDRVDNCIKMLDEAKAIMDRTYILLKGTADDYKKTLLEQQDKEEA